MARKKHSHRYVWWAGVFFAAGYLPVAGLTGLAPAQAASVATTLAVALLWPLAVKTSRPARAVLLGLGLGLAAGLGAGLAMQARPMPRQEMANAASLAAALSAGCCAVAGGLFAHLAQRRRRLLGEE